MQRKYRIVIGVVLAGLLFAFSVPAQSRTNRLYRPCPSSVSLAKVEIQSDGDIDLIPCSGRSVLINGSSTSGLLTGTGTANFVPRFTSGTAVGNTPISWDGTHYVFNNTALDSEFTLDFTPSTTVGRFRIGDFTTTATSYFDLNQATSNVYFQSDAANYFSILPTGIGSTVGSFSLTSTGILGITLDSKGVGPVNIGDWSGFTNGTYLKVDDSTQTVAIKNNNVAAILDLQEAVNVKFQRTITPGGTTGNRTINQTAGTVNFAAGTSAITVTNSTVTSQSLIFLTLRTLDATCTTGRVVAGAGSFVVTLNANCTAETSVGFLVTN